MLATVEDLNDLPTVSKKMNGVYDRRGFKPPVKLEARTLPGSLVMFVSLLYYQELPHSVSVFRCWFGEFPKALVSEWREDREIPMPTEMPNLNVPVDLDFSRKFESEIEYIYEVWSRDGKAVRFEFKFEGGGVYTASISDTSDFDRWLYTPFLG